jgi:hypothetical protein
MPAEQKIYQRRVIKENKMRKHSLFFFLVLINGFTLCADGKQEKDRQAYEQIQLKIMNLTDDKMLFYFNKLYDPQAIEKNEEYITMKTPVNFDYPGYIVIEYGNKKHFYNYTYIGEIIPRDDRFWVITVKQDGIYFIQIPPEQFFDNTIDQHGYSELKSTSFWRKADEDQSNIIIEIQNNTDSKRRIYIYGPYEQVVDMDLDKNETGIYEIGNILFSMNRKLRIVVPKYGGVYQDIYLTNYERKNIKITLNKKGYEFQYTE